MKHIFLSLLLLISVASYAQDDMYVPQTKKTTIEQSAYNFRVVNHELVWQKSFETKMTAAQIFENLSLNADLTIRSNTEERIVLLGKAINIPFTTRYHFGAMQVSSLVANTINYSATIDIKNGRYRVSIINITFSVPRLTDGSLSETFIKKKDGRIKSSFSYSGKPLDTYFSDIFGLGQKDDAEW